MIYKKDSYVAGNMCDSKLKLSVLAADGIVENAITELMGDLGIDGIVAMEKYAAMWLMVKNHICFVRRPGWREEFEVRCFISGYTAVKLYVDTIIEETRKAAEAAGKKGPYVLVPQGTAGIMAIHWANKYPDEVKGIFGIGMAFDSIVSFGAYWYMVRKELR